MKYNNKLKKILRFTRLYAKAVFNSIDKKLNPKLSIIKFSLKSGLYDCYSLDMDVIRFINEKVIMDIRPKTKEMHLDFIKKTVAQIDIQMSKDNRFKNSLVKINKGVKIDHDIYYIITQLDKHAYLKHYRLSNKKDYPASLVDSVINEYLEDLKIIIHQFSKVDVSKELHYNDTLKHAGNKMLKVLGYTGLWDTTFHKLNKISSLNYEGEEIHGKIMFIKNEYIKDTITHPNIKTVLKLSLRVPLSNYRHVRKLLELASDNIYLIADTEAIYGIGELCNDYDYLREDLFIVDFIKHYTWELSHFDKRMMRVQYEKISLTKSIVEYDLFKREFKRVFKSITDKQLSRLYYITLAASKQQHGTMLVISKNAESEATRLKSQCFKITPKKLSPEIMESITSIDGAILLDLDCVCPAIGVILDGLATNYGSTARGARYNSAIRYVETISNEKSYSDCIAIVISEDSTLDIVSKYTINN